MIGRLVVLYAILGAFAYVGLKNHVPLTSGTGIAILVGMACVPIVARLMGPSRRRR